MTDLEALWATRPATKTWYDSLPDEPKEWFDRVVELTGKKDRLPSKRAVWSAFKTEFGGRADVHVPHEDTIRETLVRLTGVKP